MPCIIIFLGVYSVSTILNLYWFLAAFSEKGVAKGDAMDSIDWGLALFPGINVAFTCYVVLFNTPYKKNNEEE